MLGITIAVAGFIGLIYGVMIVAGVVKTKDDDWTSRLYAGSKGIMGGLAAIFLGVILYLTQ